MKKHFYILLLSAYFLFNPESVYSQVEEFEVSCKEKFSRFYNHIVGKSKTKDYKEAYEDWLICFQDCPQSSEFLYKYGNVIIRDAYESSSLVFKEQIDSIADKFYGNWIKYYPKNSSQVYDYWATSLRKRNKEKKIIYEKLNSSYRINPLSLSTKNLQIYFESRIENEEDIQKNLRFYEDVLESINIKVDSLSKQLVFFEVKEKRGEQLSKKEKLIKKNNIVILKGLGRTETIVDVILNQKYSLDCNKLISIYQEKFEQNKNNVKWLKRVLSRLFMRDCNNDFTKEIIEALVNLKITTPESLIIYHKTDQRTPYVESQLKKLIDSELDPYKKADIYYKLAFSLKNRSRSMSRAYAYRALAERPNFGRAYLLIARLYAMSANACGNDEFSKRVVFLAAAKKAEKAKEVDPSISSLATKYIKNYKKIFSTKRLYPASGKEYKIGCWIGETVKIP